MESGRYRVGVFVKVLDCKRCAMEMHTIPLRYNDYKKGFIVVVTPREGGSNNDSKRQ
jgi:hypothetical protein